ncbi:Helix-turn-helix domain [Mycobacteroides abscessus subsp. bolletii]|uniref:helix-turn-helix domain-containing protein n=1 Tax=Mycobacteroides abscessus TaxID=36809 RepID=UPI0009A5BCEC|nr:helix-turn-helix domain-containing protein [Mycobacteroides abscessus]SKX65743.1 Helix-turn-helix domain [Mycobacteroides abscessus subsp. bolletii]
MAAIRNLVTTATAARILGIHPETLRDWNRSSAYGIPRPYRLGNRLRWDVADLETYLSSRQGLGG